MAAYTSSDEFDIDRRVWMTNETPPYDMYKALNSSMQNGLWKWILGSSRVNYDVPHKIYEEQNGDYIHDENTDEVYLKMTNGRISPEYGPVASENHNDPNFNPHYTRLEIDGILLPEFDLLLHEVYRYLSTIYPDHPDEDRLLTGTEFNDMILASGDMINYLPDVKFFDKVSQSLDIGMTDDEIISESSKLKIRNLLNNSFRRKLYGSKAGYRMFANDIFQLCTIFPVATYLPISPIDEAQLVKEKNTKENLAVLSALNMTRREYVNYTRQKNRQIDTNSELYYRKFRLVDWDGQNSSFLQKADRSIHFYGYSVPYNENNIFEYPNMDDVASESDTIQEGYFFENTKDLKGVTYVNSISNGLFEVEIGKRSIADDDGNIESITGREFISSTREVHYLTTSQTNMIPYQTTYIYPETSEILDELTTTEGLLNVDIAWNNHFAEENSLPNDANFLMSLYNIIKKETEKPKALQSLKVIKNPFVRDTLLLEPSNTLKFYPTELSVTNSDDYMIVNQDEIENGLGLIGKYIGTNNLSESSERDLRSLYYVNGFTKGNIEYIPSNKEEVGTIPELNNDSRYAMVVKTTNDDMVIFLGYIEPTFIRDGEVYSISKTNFKITAIPEVKDEEMMLLIYSDFKQILMELKDIDEKTQQYKDFGMTENGCEDIINISQLEHSEIYSCDRKTIGNLLESIEQAWNNKVKELKDEISNGTKFGVSCEGIVNFFYKTIENGDIINIGKSPKVDIKQSCEIYKLYSDLDYSNYIVYYIRKKMLEEKVASYRENRSYLYETRKYTDNRFIDYEDYNTFEAGTICSGCYVDCIALLSMYEGRKVYNRTVNYKQGLVSLINLGNIDILPVITDGKEIAAPYKFIIHPDGTTSKALNKDSYKEYKIDEENSLYYLDIDWYHKTAHPIEKVKVDGGVVEYFINNKQTYSQIEGDDATNDFEVDDEDWFAGYDGLNIDNKNITASPKVTQKVKIECVVDVDTEGMDDIISFKNDVSKEKAKFISVGDSVFGPSLDTDDNNIYVTSIGFNSVKVNKKLTQSGTFMFTFACKLHAIAEDVSENMYIYKDSLNDNGIYSVINPFEHGLWGSPDFPRASNAILESLPDISFYKPYNYMAADVSSFTEVMSKIHPLKGKNLVNVPSTIKFMNDLFIELNLTKLIWNPSLSGKNPVLMSVDWLDYIEDNLKDISRATDHTNVGVNLMMETDSSGYYTQDSRIAYTDPNIRLKFITMNLDSLSSKPWKNCPPANPGEWSVPCYAQIGTGGEGRFDWFRSPADVTYPNVWGDNVYDSDAINQDDLDILQEENGRIRKRSTWGQDDTILIETDTESSRYHSVEKPLFEVPLGEYDVQTRYFANNESDDNKVYTTVQSSFYQETFNNITKYMLPAIVDEDSSPIIINENSLIDISPISKIDGYKILSYLGNGEITKEKDSEDLYQIVYPTTGSSGEFYTLDKTIILSEIGNESESISFPHHTILLRDDDKLRVIQPDCVGLLGEGRAINNRYSFDCISLDFIKDGDIVDYMANMTLRNFGNSINSSSKLYSSFFSEILISNKGFNKIFWFVYIGNTKDREFFIDGTPIKPFDIIGLLTPDEQSSLKKEDLKAVLFNRCYYTSTLPITRKNGVSDEVYKFMIDSDFSSIKELNEGATIIKLPRRCITEGSYNFDYTINPELVGTGYLYASSKSNEIKYSNNRDNKEYDSIENDNFDIIDKSKEYNFDLTRSAIYKDEKNNAFYTFTDNYSYIDSDGNKVETDSSDKLKKIAIKFAEQKYFKNTAYISGSYKAIVSQITGSTDTKMIPEFRGIKGVGEFNSNLISAGDRILRITPISLRSIWTKFLEPSFFANYYDLEGVIRGVDEKGNVIVSYDNSDSNKTIAERLNFTSILRNYLPVNKRLDVKLEKYVTEPYDDFYYDFETNNKFSAPTLGDVRVTKSILAEYPENLQDYEFKYFKNLLMVRGQVSTANPNKIVAANNDNGQFARAAQFIKKGDTIMDGVSLSTNLASTVGTIKVISDNGSPDNPPSINFAMWDEIGKTFFAVSNKGYIYIAHNIDYDTTSEIHVKEYLIKDFDNQSEVIKSISFNRKDNLWFINISRDGQSYIRSVPTSFEETINKGKIIETAIPYSQLQKVINPNNYETVTITNDTVLSSEESLSFNESSQDFDKEHYNFKAGEIAISSIEYTDNKKFNYKNSPYNVIGYNFSNSEEDPYRVNTFYAKDRNSEYEVYGLGRGIFIKAPIPLCDEEGRETGEISKDFYWKFVEAPLFKESTLALYKKKVNEGISGAYSMANSTRDFFLDRFNFLAETKTWVIYDSKRKAYFQTDGKGNILKGAQPNTWNKDPILDTSTDEGAQRLASWAAYYSGIETLNSGLSDEDQLTPERVYTRYYPLYEKAESIKVIPWFATTKKSVGIEDVLKNAKADPNRNYYIYHIKDEDGINIFGTNTIKPENGKDYIRIKYLSSNKKFEICYYGVGPYKHATTTDGIINDLEISSLYGMDLNFKEREIIISDDNDKEWYASYLSNLCTNAYLESDFSEVLISNIKKAIFSTTSISFVTESGLVAYIKKEDTIRKDSLSKSVNWGMANMPEELTYSYMSQGEFPITREIKYGPSNDDVFKMQTLDGYFVKSIFEPVNVYEDDGVIILCGHIKSRKAIEAQFGDDFGIDVKENVAQSQLAHIISASKYLEATTPMILFSSDGGYNFQKMDTNLKIPGFEISGSGLKVSDQSILLSKYYIEGVNNVYWVPSQEGSLSISGVHKLNGDYHYFLELSTGNKFDYELTPVIEDNYPNFKMANVEAVKQSTLSLTSSSREAYSTFETFTKGEDVIRRISNVALSIGKMTVMSSLPDEIILDNGVIGQFKKDEEISTIEVLLTFKTLLPITPDTQIKCINKNFISDYTKPNSNELKLKIVTTTDSLALADRVYSYRETLSNSEKLKNSGGYKSMAEDAHLHRFYEYNSFVDDKGNDIYQIVDARNSKNYPVYLCSANGNYITENDGTSFDELNIFNMLDLSEKIVDYDDVLQKFGKPKYTSLGDANGDGTLRDEDESFITKDIKNLIKINAKYNSTLPCEYIYRSNNNCQDVLTKGNVIYQIPANGTNYITIGTSAPEGYINKGEVSSLGDLKFTDIKDYFEYVGNDLYIGDSFVALNNTLTKEFVEKYLYVVPEDELKADELKQQLITIIDKGSPYITSQSPWANLENRIIEKTLVVESTVYKVLFDKMFNYYPLRCNRFISFRFRSTFANTLPLKMYINESFNNVIGEESRADAVTGIYLPQRGYGGTRLRNDQDNTWDDVLPWDLDPDAFENEYLLNRYGDNITLCNNAGVELMSDNGEVLAENGHKIIIKSDDIENGSYKNIDIFKLEDNKYKSINSIKIHKPSKSEASIWVSQNDVYIKFGEEAGLKNLANIKYSEPSRFIFEDLDISKTSIESTLNGTDFNEDDNFIIQDGILKYNLPKEVLEYPKGIRVIYKLSDKVTLTKDIRIIQLNTSTVDNVIYTTLNPTFYYKNPENDKYHILVSGETSLNSNTKVLELSDTFNTIEGLEKPTEWPNQETISVSDTDNIMVNIPIFNIGETKSFYFYDFDNKKYIIESFIGDLRLIKDVLTIDVNSDIYTTTFKKGNLEFIISKDTISEPSNKNPDAYLKILPGSTFTPVSNPLYDGNPNQNITKSEFELVNNLNVRVSVKGTYSPIYMRKNVYNSFRILTSNKGYIIKSYEDIYNRSKDGDLNVLFSNIEGNKIVFDKAFSTTQAMKDCDLDDGFDHFLRFEILTQKSVFVPETNLNDPEYYTEVSLDDVKSFPPDRVFFNEKGYPKSPVLLNNNIFRAENNEFYTKEYFVNTNNGYIRECNENGEYIRYYISDGKLASRSIISGVDRLKDVFIPHRPNYMSCQDWFENEFYIRGNESNPFWQVVNLRAIFNSVTQTWTQNLSLNKFEKVGVTIKQVPVTEEEAYLELRKASSAKVIDGDIKQDYNTNYLDLFEGEIRFIALKPNSPLYNENNIEDNNLIIKYGICAQNTLIGRSFGRLEKGLASYPGYLQSSYTVNSRKNMANSNDKDSAIVEITEMGLFNKKHELIAYAVFPPIEYRSDSQHVSFTSFIKFGACTVDIVEESRDDEE